MRIAKDTRGVSAPERRRRRILDAALELVGEGGPDAITHRAVAKRAKVSLGSTTYHYGTREELMRAAFLHYLAGVKAVLGTLGVKTRRAGIADVAQLAVDVARRSMEEPITVRAEYELVLHSARDPVVAREFVAYQRLLQGELAMILERVDVRRPHDAARTVIDMVRGFELEHLARAEADTEDLRRRVQTFLEALTTQDRANASSSPGSTGARSAPAARPRKAPPRRRTTTR